MSTYVLVHGAWHGPWCWGKVVPLLKQAGHRVEIPDLSGYGQDKTFREITLTTYTQRVCETLDAQAEPVILVGHSLGGIVISQVAEERPEKIQTLVYLTAFLVQNGESVFQAAHMNSDSLVTPNLVVNEEQGSLTFKEGAPLKDMFYGDCSDEDVARATSLLVPAALAPQGTPSGSPQNTLAGCQGSTLSVCVTERSPHLFRKGCTQSCRVKPSSRWRPATRLSSQHPRS